MANIDLLRVNPKLLEMTLGTIERVRQNPTEGRARELTDICSNVVNTRLLHMIDLNCRSILTFGRIEPKAVGSNDRSYRIEFDPVGSIAGKGECVQFPPFRAQTSTQRNVSEPD